MHLGIRRGEIEAPGLFVKNYPAMMVAGFLMLHLIYGLLVGTVSEGLA